MLGKRLINSNSAAAGGSCTTDTLQILGDTSCIAYYKMSNATDESGNYDGTPTDVNFNVAGKFGNAGSFNGSSSVIDTNFTVPASSTFSISWWMNASTASIAGNHYIFGDNDNQGSDVGFAVYNNNSGIGAYGYGFNTGLISTTYKGSWVHFAIVLDGSTFNFYQDGVSIDTRTITSRSSASSRSLIMGRFGAYAAGSQFHYDGKIDQVRIFNKALSSTEVTTLYNEVYCVPTIVPTDHFEPVIYTGNNSTQSITSLNFAPDLVWIKSRSNGTSNELNDSVRGQVSRLFSDSSSAQGTVANGFLSLDSNGFSLNSAGGGGEVNGLNRTYVAWNWKAAATTTTIAANTVGNTIASDVRANVDAGFSIVKYSSGSSATGTVGHGLSEPPQLVIQKSLGVDNWFIANNAVSGTTNYEYMLFTSAAQSTNWTFWDGASAPTSTTFKNGWDGNREMINYCFHSVDGYSKIGSYAGTGANGNSIVTGFRPAFVMVKPSSLDDNWLIYDNKRGNDIALFANLSNADTTYAGRLELNSNGFTLNTTNSGWNGSSASYIFMAFAEEVFTPITRNATNPFGDASEVALYKFEDNANDSEGNYNGTASNVTYATGYIDKAAVFNGSSSYITLTQPANLSTDDFTYSFWIYPTTNTGYGAPLAQYGKTTAARNFYSYRQGSTLGKIVFGLIGNNGSFNQITSTGTTALNQWSHVVFVRDSSTQKIYLNGQLSGSLSNTTTTSTSSEPFLIGDTNDNASEFFTGSIDQVRVFNKALDDGEVMALYLE